MDKTIKAITAIIIAIACVAALMVTAEAEERYIEKKFVFGKYAPTVVIEHPVYTWVLESQPDGSLKWSKPVEGKHSQIFTILPGGYSGYYKIREFDNGGYEQRYLSYTKTGFRLEYAGDTEPSAMAFRPVWKSSDKCGGKSFRNVWRLSYTKIGMCACFGGWGAVRLRQTNWSENY